MIGIIVSMACLLSLLVGVYFYCYGCKRVNALTAAKGDEFMFGNVYGDTKQSDKFTDVNPKSSVDVTHVWTHDVCGYIQNCIIVIICIYVDVWMVISKSSSSMTC